MKTVFVMYLGRSKLIFTKELLMEELPTYLDVPGINFRLQQIEMSEEEYAKLPQIDLRPNAQHTIRQGSVQSLPTST